MNRNSANREGGARQDPGTFENFEVYRVARQFRQAMYAVAKSLPDVERFGLAPQMRRAALSLTNNIAEGHGRYYYLDQIKFMFHSRGSLQELLGDLNACEDEHYLSQLRIDALKQEGWRVRQLIDGYIAYLRRKKEASSKVKEEEHSDYAFPAESTNYESTNYDRPDYASR